MRLISELWKVNHVEGDDILERDIAIFMRCDQVFVNAFRRGACWKSNDEGLLWSRRECFDPSWLASVAAKCPSR